MSYYKKDNSSTLVNIIVVIWILGLIAKCGIRGFLIIIGLVVGISIITFLFKYYGIKKRANEIIKEVMPKLKNINESKIKDTVMLLENQYNQFKEKINEDIMRVTNRREKLVQNTKE